MLALVRQSDKDRPKSFATVFIIIIAGHTFGQREVDATRVEAITVAGNE
jgi:hypothetical protein